MNKKNELAEIDFTFKPDVPYFGLHNELIEVTLTQILRGTPNLAEKRANAALEYKTRHKELARAVCKTKQQLKVVEAIEEEYSFCYTYSQQMQEHKLLVPMLIKALGTDINIDTLLSSSYIQEVITKQTNKLTRSINILLLNKMEVDSIKPIYVECTIETGLDYLEGVLDLKEAVKEVSKKYDVKTLQLVNKETGEEITMLTLGNDEWLSALNTPFQNDLRQDLQNVLQTQLEETLTEVDK